MRFPILDDRIVVALRATGLQTEAWRFVQSVREHSADGETFVWACPRPSIHALRCGTDLPCHQVTVSIVEQPRRIKFAFRLGEHVCTFGFGIAVELRKKHDVSSSVLGVVHVAVRTTVEFRQPR